MSLWSRLANVFRAGRVQRELDEELQFHIDERIRELTDLGMPREAAAREVARRFGSPLRLREKSLDIKLLPWLDSVVRDVRLGLRVQRKDAVVTAAAVLSLALALGACVAAFSLVDALILRPLPVRHPGQLVYLAFPTYTPERPEADTFSDPLFVRLRAAARGRVDLFAMSTQVIRPVTFTDTPGDAGRERLRTQYISGDAFDRLGITPAAGRLLGSRDDIGPGAEPVAVLSHAFWMRRFGGDPAIIGRSVALQDRQFQIVGVAERRFAGVEPGRPTDLWLPYAMYNPRAFGNADFNWFRVVGRMADATRLDQAQSVLQAAFTSFRRDYVLRSGPGPNRSPESIARFVGTPIYVRSAASGTSPLRSQFERSLWILSSIAVLVLLIAGSNVANLFLARSAAREREMALRLSIGASRGRLIQQMLVESALVAGAACAIGLLFAAVSAPAVVGMLASADDPVYLDLGLDWRLLAFAGGLTVLTCALFGLVPAFRASNVAPLAALKTGERSGARAGVMRPFVAAQVAFGLVVLFVGTLLVLSFARLSSVNPGFAASDVLLLSVESVQPVDATTQRTALLQVLDRLRGVPGVQAVSAAEYNPIGRAWTYNVRLPGTPHETIETTMAPVTAGFFETMNIPVLAGRAFVRGDIDTNTSTAIVVSDAFARRYFGREPAVGRTLEGRFGMDNDTVVAYDVVGVVADTRYDLHKPAAPIIYIPMRSRNTGTIHVRVAGDPAALASRLREEVRAASPSLRVTTITSQSLIVGRTLLRERLLALLAGFFGVTGLVLAAVGLYGVLSYSVVQRTREIGIRVALGARQLSVVRTVLAETGSAVLTGAAAGLAAALYLSRFVEAMLFEVTPLDFWSLALPLGALLLAAVLAAMLPALRVARVDPVIALRYE
jgi:putative ABC transport system permease protein